MRQGGIKYPALGTQGCFHFQIPLLLIVGAVHNRPSATFDVVDQNIQPAEAVDSLFNHPGYCCGLAQVGS